MLDNFFTSSQAATRISIPTTMYTKRFNGQEEGRTSYFDKFESLFAQLDHIGTDTSIPDSHKAPLLLGSMSSNSPLQCAFPALRTCKNDKLTWEHTTAYLIQERGRLKCRVGTNNIRQNRSPDRHGIGERKTKIIGL